MRATSLIRIVQLGVKSLLLHKMRSGLTMLGIIFGVCSVIAMLAIGEGASYEAQEAIKKLGSSNIILRSIKPPQDAKAATAGRSYVNEYGITYSDVARLDSTIPGIRRVLPMRIIRDEVRFNNLVQQAQIIGTHPIYAEMTGVDLVRGRFAGRPVEPAGPVGGGRQEVPVGQRLACGPMIGGGDRAGRGERVTGREVRLERLPEGGVDAILAARPGRHPLGRSKVIAVVEAEATAQRLLRLAPPRLVMTDGVDRVRAGLVGQFGQYPRRRPTPENQPIPLLFQ